MAGVQNFQRFGEEREWRVGFNVVVGNVEGDEARKVGYGGWDKVEVVIGKV